jgi:hypothetical protein
MATWTFQISSFIKFKMVLTSIKRCGTELIPDNCKELYDFEEKNGRESFLRSLLAP